MTPSGTCTLLPVNNQDQANCWTDLTKLVTDNTSAHNSNYQPSKLSLGAYSNVSEASKGEVAELIAFDSVLSTADRQKIEGYLAHKWGLSSILPNTHPAKSASIITSPADIDTHTVNLSNLVSGNTYYYRVKVTNSEGTDWADSTASFTSESALSLNSGNLLFDTSGPTPSWSASDGTSGNGVLETLSWTDSQSNTIQYKSAKYSFESLTIGDGVNVTLMGDNPIHIDITGDGTINAVLDANGSHGNTGYLTQWFPVILEVVRVVPPGLVVVAWMTPQNLVPARLTWLVPAHSTPVVPVKRKAL